MSRDSVNLDDCAKGYPGYTLWDSYKYGAGIARGRQHVPVLEYEQWLRILHNRLHYQIAHQGLPVTQTHLCSASRLTEEAPLALARTS